MATDQHETEIATIAAAARRLAALPSTLHVSGRAHHAHPYTDHQRFWSELDSHTGAASRIRGDLGAASSAVAVFDGEHETLIVARVRK